MQRMIRVAILNAECIESRENIIFAANIAHLKKLYRLGEENNISPLNIPYLTKNHRSKTQE